MVKNNLLATVCAAALATGLGIGAASAGEPDWQGFYGGLHTGYGAADLDLNAISSASSSAAKTVTSLDGGLVGAHVGYNWHLNNSNVVFGLEADLDYAVHEWEETVIDASGTSDGFHGEQGFLASLRARLGIDVGGNGDALVYVTGGVAYTDTDATLHAFTAGGKENIDWDWGGVIGAGVEHMVTPRLSVRAEALYYFFGEEDWIAQTSVTTGRDVGDMDLNIFTVRVGVSYQLGTFR